MLVEFSIVLALLLLGFTSGKWLEARHYRSIRQREEEWSHVPVVTFRTLPGERPVGHATLAAGSVVISVDFWKRFLSGLRAVFGGEMHSYAPLLDRARREAVLRMKESYPAAHLFMNLRFETVSISKGAGRRIGSVEVLAYATAIRYADEVRSEEAR